MTNVADFRAQAQAMMGGGNNNNQNQGNTDDRPKEEFWMNVGLRLTIPDPETGEPMEVFASLPVGIPFGQMTKRVPRGNDPLNNQRAEVGNMLMEKWQGEMKTLKPGEAMAIDADIEIRRVNIQGSDGTEAAGHENPLMVAARQAMGG